MAGLETSTTLLAGCMEQFERLAAACGYPNDDVDSAARVVGLLAESWGSQPVNAMPRWSGVTDDCSPFEFSLAIDRSSTQLRMLAEAQGDPASPERYWSAGMSLTRALETQAGASTAALELVADLFEPTADAYFAMMHGVVFPRDAPPQFKVYLNPKAQGQHAAEAVVRSALARLGHSEAADYLSTLARQDDEYQFLCLDLGGGADARTKVYVRHRRCSVDGLETRLRETGDIAAADGRALCETLLGVAHERLPRPPLTMYTFRRRGATRQGPAVHLPTFPYAGSDEDVSRRVCSLLERYGLPTSTYLRCLHALTAGPLSQSAGIHNYVSVQRQNGSPRVTVYLCPRMFLETFGPIGFEPKVAWPSPVND